MTTRRAFSSNRRRVSSEIIGLLRETLAHGFDETVRRLPARTPGKNGLANTTKIADTMEELVEAGTLRPIDVAELIEAFLTIVKKAAAKTPNLTKDDLLAPVFDFIFTLSRLGAVELPGELVAREGPLIVALSNGFASFLNGRYRRATRKLQLSKETIRALTLPPLAHELEGARTSVICPVSLVVCTWTCRTKCHQPSCFSCPPGACA